MPQLVTIVRQLASNSMLDNVRSAAQALRSVVSTVRRMPRGDVFRRSVRVLGLRYTCRLYAANLLQPDSHAYDEPFDSRLAIDTSGIWGYQGGELPAEVDGSAEGYEGARIDVVRHAFELIPSDRAEMELWDLGSGKGRVVIFAAEMGFKRAVGVELNERLHEQAHANTKRLSTGFSSTDVELIHASASTVDLPDDPLVVFMFNPFRGSVFQSVVRSLEDRASRTNSPLWVIYVNPKERDVLDRSSHFELAAREKLSPHWWSIDLYRGLE